MSDDSSIPFKYESPEERDYDVEFSTIAYITVRVSAPSAQRARSKGEYVLKGKDPNGQWTRGKRAILCVTLSGSSLQLDSCEEIITKEESESVND